MYTSTTIPWLSNCLLHTLIPGPSVAVIIKFESLMETSAGLDLTITPIYEVSTSFSFSVRCIELLCVRILSVA